MHVQQLWLAGAAVLFGTTCQGPHRGRARALVLSQGPDQEEPIRILAFGDSYAAFAPGAGILKPAFARYGKTAEVYNSAVSGTRSCQWAEFPNNLLTLSNWAFGANKTDYVWVSLGGNDQKHPPYRECATAAGTFEETKACVKWNAERVALCQSDLVNRLFEGNSHAKVLYTGYDLSCTSGDCMPMVRYPFCGMDVSCFEALHLFFQDTIRQRVTDRVPAEHKGRYVTINIAGSMQQAAGMPATPGSPVWGTGSPCSLLQDCHHPKSWGAAAWYLGEAFMVNFFKEELHLQSQHAVPPRYDPLDTHLIGYDSDREDIRCNQDWVPNVEDPACPAPPCNRANTDWLGKRREQSEPPERLVPNRLGPERLEPELPEPPEPEPEE